MYAMHTMKTMLRMSKASGQSKFLALLDWWNTQQFYYKKGAKKLTSKTVVTRPPHDKAWRMGICMEMKHDWSYVTKLNHRGYR